MRLILFFFILSIQTLSWSQNKVSWAFSYAPEEETVKFTAIIEDGWHIYSQYTDEAVGPVATRFEFSKANDVRLKGKVQEPESIKTFDENFGGEVMYFEDQVIFDQQVKVKSTGVLKGTITYMVCNKEMCLPPVDEKFEIEIKE